MKHTFLALSLLGVSVLTTGCESESVAPDLNVEAQTAAKVAPDRNYKAHLTGDQQVPVVVTQAVGQAKYRLSDDGLALEYKVNLANLGSLTVAHLHLGAVGVNGRVIADLYPGGAPQLNPTGPVLQGTITAANLVGPLSGRPLSALLAAIDAGNVYTNVHSQAYPAGEIRGQVE
ncbi:CHRD domain-containing protein [Hymenobacter antarcticus]|uniref:CHRD domain-containing protein n=1 Tax=Hymenobacter antarcticus TaxID=486270 RepID=A0ABP7Q5Z2_9BACT